MPYMHDTEAHRGDMLMFTVQADEMWEHSPSFQDVVVNPCHQVMVNTMCKQNRAFFYYINKEMVSNNTAFSNPAYLV